MPRKTKFCAENLFFVSTWFERVCAGIGKDKYGFLQENLCSKILIM